MRETRRRAQMHMGQIFSIVLSKSFIYLGKSTGKGKKSKSKKETAKKRSVRRETNHKWDSEVDDGERRTWMARKSLQLPSWIAPINHWRKEWERSDFESVKNVSARLAKKSFSCPPRNHMFPKESKSRRGNLFCNRHSALRSIKKVRIASNGSDSDSVLGILLQIHYEITSAVWLGARSYEPPKAHHRVCVHDPRIARCTFVTSILVPLAIFRWAFKVQNLM